MSESGAEAGWISTYEGCVIADYALEEWRDRLDIESFVCQQDVVEVFSCG